MNVVSWEGTHNRVLTSMECLLIIEPTGAKLLKT